MAIIAGPITLETGDLSQFNATDIAGSGAISADAGAAKNGSYGLRGSVADASGGADRAEGRFSFSSPASDLVVLRLWFRWNSFTNAGFGLANARSIALLTPDNTNIFSRAAWLGVVGTRQIQLGVRLSDASETLVGSPVTLSAATWYAIQLLVNRSGADPIASWSLSSDGISYTEQASTTDTSSGSAGLALALNGARVGVVFAGQFEDGTWSTDSDDHTVYDAVPVAAASGGFLTPMRGIVGP